MTALLRSERGAIMVIGLFMAIFATGCLYYVVELGDAIAQRERMQDAADAAAFSAAALHARGMNVIALVNMTMAALLAVLITLKLVEMLAWIGVAFATGLAFFTSGGSLAAVPGFTTIAIDARTVHEEAQPAVHASLRILHIAARGVRIAMPWVAQARTVQTVVSHYKPPAWLGFEVPGSITLPTRDGSYDDLCKKSGEYVADLVDLSLAPINTVGFSISDFTGGIVDTGSAWFCETDGASPPGRRIKRDVDHPVMPKTRACDELARSDRADPSEHDRICAEALSEAAEAVAAIDPETGVCTGYDCGPDGVYEQRATLAQQECAPRGTDQDVWVGRFMWQARTFRRRYVLINSRWEVEVERVPGSERLELKRRTPRPCARTEWSTTRRRDGELVPICDDIGPPTTPQAYADGVAELVHTEVLQVFGCVETVRERRELDRGGGELSASSDGQDMAPQLIAHGAALGGEPFQIRAFVARERSSSSIEAILSGLRSDAAKDNAAQTALWSAATELSLVSVAQAEFYFDGRDPDPADLLWRMGWTARLRRFRVPGTEPGERSTDDRADAALNDVEDVLGSISDACATFLGGDFPCDILDFSAHADLFVH